MFLEQIDIYQFRGIRQLSIRLGQTTVLIGENNTGKSTILDAVHLALGSVATHERVKFAEYDHHLATSDSQASDGDPIEIVLHFSEQANEEWSDSIVQKLKNIIQYDDTTGRHSVTLRVRSVYNAAMNESVPEWVFLNLNKEPLIAHPLYYKRMLQSLVHIFPLKSRRDSDSEFRSRSPLWGPFVRALSMDPDLTQSLEDELASLNQKIIDAHGSFSTIEEHLQDIAKMVPLADSDTVNIEALPSSVLDVLSRTRVYLSSITGAKIPIGQHGEGTQSLAIVCLFVAHLQSKLDGEGSNPASHILTLEEPEAHLHPSATYSVANLLNDQRGQNIIATHSGDLVSNVKVSALRRLRRKDGNVTVHQVDWDAFNSKQRNAISHQIRISRGNILFARCWLLVEGKTEVLVFERCATICGMDLAREGVCCVEYSQLTNPRTLIKFAKQIGIEWFIVADGDNHGNSNVKRAEGELCGEDKETHICQLEHTMDVVLCLEGYGHHYEQDDLIDVSNQTLTKDAAYWKKVVRKKSKTTAATLAVDEMGEMGRNRVPEVICRIIAKSIQLARGA